MDENIDHQMCPLWWSSIYDNKTIRDQSPVRWIGDGTFSPSFMKQNKKVWALQILNKSSLCTDWPANTCGMFEREREIFVKN